MTQQPTPDSTRSSDPSLDLTEPWLIELAPCRPGNQDAIVPGKRALHATSDADSH